MTKSSVIAMLQMPVEYGKPEINLRKADEMLRKAKERGAVCAVLPECCDIGWAAPDALLLAQPVPGGISAFFCMEADKYGLWIAAGITEREGGLIYNLQIVFSLYLFLFFWFASFPRSGPG